SNSKILPDRIELNKDFGFFIGIFLAEGYIKNNRAVEISNKNIEIQNRVIEFSKKLKLNYYQHKNGVSVFSKNLCSILKAYCYDNKELNTINKGVKGNYSRLKKIPEFLFFAPREFIYGLISGLFSGDGRLIKDKKMLKGFELVTVLKSHGLKRCSIFGCSKCRPHSKECGFRETLRHNYNQKETEYYSISVPTYMIKIFLKHIEFLGRKIKVNSSNPIYSYNDLIPCGDILYQLVKKLGYNRRINGDRDLKVDQKKTVKN
ncbi:hypothetical protein J4416_01150, partial [Candidatus Pacearchaeota archaeon]|nr:hypothetical protein [Candidatus Pacearchaeota archaeon]